MARVKPCGTWAAYVRHQRAGEEPCDECTVAAREYRALHRVKGEGDAVGRVEDHAPSGAVFELPDEVSELEDQFKIVTAAMRSAKTPSSAISSLSLRRQALYDALADARRRTDLGAVMRAAVAEGNADAAARAVEDAGGSALDVLLARRKADAKPIRTARVLDDDAGERQDEDRLLVAEQACRTGVATSRPA